MSDSRPDRITELLHATVAEQGDAWSRLLPLVDHQLRRLADARLGRTPQSSLQTTDLVHETYLQLMQKAGGNWRDRRHFYGVAAHAMRHLLVDRARRATAQKRGGGRRPIELGEHTGTTEPPTIEMLALHDALRELATLDRTQHEIVMLRYFGGLGIDEVASTLGTSPSTIDRQWRFARAWLRQRINGNRPTEPCR